MKLSKFNLNTIEKGAVISLFFNIMGSSEPIRCRALFDNISVKLCTKYDVGIKREKDLTVETEHDDNSKNILFVKGISTQHHAHEHSQIVANNNYHNYIFRYGGPRGTHVKSHFIFAYGYRMRSNIKEFSKYIDKKKYTSEYILETFTEHETIVIDQDGKMFYYKIENNNDMIKMYARCYYCETKINYFVSKIIRHKSIYNLPNGTLHKNLLCRLDMISKYKLFGKYLLSVPLDIRNIILKLLMITLCTKNEDIQKILAETKSSLI